jgi:dimeric dUTPase (all-alpha-NTP-PPase superfamily)
MHNAKVEVVDILHFVLSLIIDSRLKVGAADVAAIFIPDVYNESKGYGDISKAIKQIKSLMKATLKGKDPIFILFKLFKVAVSLDLTVRQVEKLYWGKNVLNKFRQDNGYAKGAYSKHWNGVEDNVILLRLLEEDVKDIYGELDKLYRGT